MPAFFGAGIFCMKRGARTGGKCWALTFLGAVFLGEKRGPLNIKKPQDYGKSCGFMTVKPYLYLEITSSFNSKKVPFFMASRARSIKRIKKRMLCMEIKRWLVSSAERNKWLI